MCERLFSFGVTFVLSAGRICTSNTPYCGIRHHRGDSFELRSWRKLHKSSTVLSTPTALSDLSTRECVLEQKGVWNGRACAAEEEL
ncbi:hypothetical protein BC835DRAFT_209429 [Cytidiella melzeri]|nr:hypothetical protein BC835DRAFT_209429 [Cytidiella melzeri]